MILSSKFRLLPRLRLPLLIRLYRYFLRLVSHRYLALCTIDETNAQKRNEKLIFLRDKHKITTIKCLKIVM